MKTARARYFSTAMMIFIILAASCTESPFKKENEIIPGDVLSRFDQLTRFQETKVIDLSDPESVSHLRAGWKYQRKGLTWSRGLRCTLVFTTYYSTSGKEIIFTCVPSSDTTARRISVSLNGRKLEDIKLKDIPHRYSVAVPAEVQKQGQNLLDFSFSEDIAPQDPIARDLSLGFEEIVIKGSPTVRRSYWDSKKTGQLVQFSGSAFLYSAVFSTPARLEIDYRLKNRAEAVINIQPAGQNPQTHTLAGDRRKAVIEIPRGEGSPVKIEFIASGSKKGKIIWNKINIIPEDSPTAAAKPTSTHEISSDDDRQKKPDIIFYVIDALRSDHLGCYGYGRNTSPSIDAFARENTLYMNAFSNSSWTRPSGATLLTGLRVKNHKTMMRDSTLSEKLVTLAEILKENGYFTAAFNTNGNVGKKFGFDQGFDEFVVMAEDRNRESIHVRSNTINRRIVKFLRKFLSRDDRQPLFLWIWSTDPHDPYTPHPSVSGYFDIERHEPVDKKYRLLQEFTRRVQDSRFTWPSLSQLDHMITLYDQEILFNDISFGRLMKRFARMGLYEDALIILTADHGEEFKDHGWYGHGKTLYNEQVKIPLIIKAKNIKPGVEKSHVQHTDLYPTLCDILNISLPYDLDGDSLIDSAKLDSRAIFAEEALDGHYLRSVVLGPHKVIYNLPEGKYLHLGWRSVLPFEMYHLRNDPQETNNIIDLTDTVCSYLKQRLFFEFASPLSRLGIQYQKTDIPPKLEETMRALGYIK